MKG
ncbi:hypothetical protein CP082626L3_0662, partial [Chlamydia psittaci 08-2626_L3]|jgi:hypothetical protein